MLSTDDQNSRVAANCTPSRSERSKRDKLARIKRAARKLFARRGFVATTTREIAEAADIGAGTLFLYVGSKQDLLVLIFREDMERVVREAFATMPKRALRDQILHVFDAMIAYHELDLGLARVFVKELPFVEDRRHGVAEFMSMLFAGLADLIEQAKSRRELKIEVPARGLARNLFALYFAELQRWLGSGPVSPARRDESIRAAVELQLSGLSEVASTRAPLRRRPILHRRSFRQASPKKGED
ncbi:TetR/AcrR family transcriptional regulator [Candidatus Binatus sp.]|uniref:TetR/AcrR family transcriptional regulator n=1 Tax=Candidatus Binatus sp. TaxID=2811406 RepID=UPI00272A0F80|nr:TetR/AcrR family transcriptional regulator [Candidatus Binatus sp.]